MPWYKGSVNVALLIFLPFPETWLDSLKVLLQSWRQGHQIDYTCSIAHVKLYVFWVCFVGWALNQPPSCFYVADSAHFIPLMSPTRLLKASNASEFYWWVISLSGGV